MNDDLRCIFKNKSRLYAYPLKPDPINSSEFIILDSGAYGLSKIGLEIDAEHMFKLSSYYKQHQASNQFPVLGIAPDKYLDPHQTMSNYRFWMKYIQHPVVPVIQFPKEGKIDIFSALKQVDYYIRGNRIMAISNPGLKAKKAEPVKYVIDYMRKKGVEWIHNLGAGWNTKDCYDWFDIGFDSIDSISYRTDASRGVQWSPYSYDVRFTGGDYNSLVINNFNLANSYKSI